jgi:SAM-dependent methyltransferase
MTVKSLAKRFLSQISKPWHLIAPPTMARRRGLNEEEDFWREWFETKGGQYPDEYEWRLASEAEVQDPALRAVLEQVERDPIAVLDVGAGPCSAVGQRFQGRCLAVTAVDPLAARYDRLLATFAITPPVRTQVGAGEDLPQHFAADTFDVAYARNSLDHSADPLLSIRHMLSVIRPGGNVVLRHGRNEAEYQRYGGLHRWNLDCENGRFLLWRPRQRVDVGAELGGAAEVTCQLESGQDNDVVPDESDPGWVVARIRKVRQGF